MKILIRVATYWNGDDPAKMRKSHVNCYTLWFNREWTGYAQFEVKAKDGREAKKIAAAMRVDWERAKAAGEKVIFQAPNRFVEVGLS